MKIEKQERKEKEDYEFIKLKKNVYRKLCMSIYKFILYRKFLF